MYYYRKRDIYLQGVVAVMLVLFGLLVGSWPIVAMLGFFTFILIKDCIKLSRTVITVKGDRIEVRIGEQLDRTLYYRDLQYITRTRRNKKWVVVGHDKNIFYIRPSISNYEQMTQEVLKYNRSNKKLFIHETIISK